MTVLTESSIIVHPLQPTIGAEISGVERILIADEPQYADL
jgi:hypothetical protein